MFRHVKKLLVLAVGGGNDGISSLWLLRQLAISHQLRPQVIDMACMLPDGIEYHDCFATHYPEIIEVLPGTFRTINGARVKAFPEPTLAGAKEAFGIRRVLGLKITAGTIGLTNTVSRLIETEGYDLLLAIDVGGDFIADYNNNQVLSPWMDAYAAFALQQIQRVRICPIKAAVMGLGTDGESEPAMLERALARVGPCIEGEIDPEKIAEVTRFYTDKVRPQRRSQTGDLMVDALNGKLSLQQTVTRYFHVRQASGTKKFTTSRVFELDPRFTRKFYLFDRLDRIQNRFIRICHSSLEWVKLSYTPKFRFQHELVNQTLEGTLIATPSWMFAPEQRSDILHAIRGALQQDLYERALVYPEDYDLVSSAGTARKLSVLQPFTV